MPVIVGPDEESAQWVGQVARLCGAPWATLAKTRDGDTQVRVALAQGTLVPGRTPVLLDDIVSTGETLLAATELLHTLGMAAPVCVAVHLVGGSLPVQRLLEKGVRRFASCDSIAHESNAIALAPLLAAALPR
jgi:ribose-phosphate pyrophosphokinase